MNSNSDRPAPDTRDTRIFDPGSENENPTKTLEIIESTAETVEIGAPRKHIVGSRISSSGNIGGYQIIRKLGEGGMGVVYEAEQQTPRRRVALKVIRGGLSASDYHLRMFDREIQALARLKHPGIVSIYEAGRFDDGQVFFAMELVQGKSLVDLIDETDAPPLAVDEKLRLLSKICDIVSYAHQRGVIHRDLKPHNIFLADAESETSLSSNSSIERSAVKVLDFGLARITDPDLDGATDVSQIGHVKGTLNYMSPEQLTGNPADVDVRSDVYSLGVIAYELLTGRLPYDIRRVPVPEAMRIIREHRPEPLSRSITASISEGRRSVPRIDRDVETVVLKALEKEPDRRYQSVAAMIDDINRYLTDQPILARPPSTFYQLRKLVLRHKVAAASLGGLFLMLLAFGIAMAAQNARIASERNIAWAAQQLAEEEGFRADEALEREQKQRVIAERNLARAEEQQRIAEREKSEAEKARRSEQEQRLIAETNLKRAQKEQQRAELQTLLAQKQESIAREQKTLAQVRQAEAEEQRSLAERREEANRELLYLSQMNLAEQALEIADVDQLQYLLDAQIPQPGKKDLRGFEWFYLWKLANRQLWTLDELATGAFFSPTGGTLAANVMGAVNGIPAQKIVLVDDATGKPTAAFEGRALLGYLPDGKLLTVPVKPINMDALMKVASQIDPALLSEVVKRNDPAELIELAKKISRAISQENDKETITEILDPKTGKLEPSRLKITPSLAPFHFLSPNGKVLVHQDDRAVDLWDVESGNRSASFKDENDKGFWNFSGYSSDGKLVALLHSRIGANQRAVVWDTEAGREVFAFEGRFRSVALTHDGQFLAAMDRSGLVTYFDLALRRESIKRQGDRTDQKFGSGIDNLVFSPDGVTVALVSGRAVVLKTPCGEDVLAGHSSFVSLTKFSFDSKRIATVGADGKLKLWGNPCVATGQQVGHDPAVSPDGTMLATRGRNDLTLWEIDTNRELASLGADGTEKTYLFSPKFSPNGKFLAVIRGESTGSAAGELRRAKLILELWDIASRTRLASFGEGVGKFEFSPDGRFIAAVNRNKALNIAEFDVDLWDIANREKVFSVGKGSSVTFSPDGKILATASKGKVRMIDISSKEEIGSYFKVSTLAQEPIKFSPDGRLLATIVENDVIIWDLEGRNEITTLKGHAGIVGSIAFSPDGTRLATSSSQDETVKIWDTKTWQKLVSFKLSNASSVLFSPDGRSLIVEGSRGTQIWRGASAADISAKSK